MYKAQPLAAPQPFIISNKKLKNSGKTAVLSCTKIKLNIMAKENSDIFRVEIYVSKEEEIKRILEAFLPGTIQRKTKQKDEQIVLDAYLTESQIEWLKKNGYSYKIIDNATKTGIERQKEVGKGNRYENKNTTPHGLGKKIK
jgi:hypothetical protein